MKFWNWKINHLTNQETGVVETERVLTLNGVIAEESWYDDDITPQMFQDELNAGDGDIVININSPGGDTIAAAQIYNMISAYKGHVTVKIDGIAASAASVIAMAGDRVLMSPVSLIMIHNPSTVAFGDHAEMQKAIDMLDSVKESIINAYVVKTGLSRAKLSHLMDSETWMDVNAAMELGFADGVIGGGQAQGKDPMLYSQRQVNNILQNKIERHYAKPKEPMEVQAVIKEPETGRPVSEIMERLFSIKKYI